MSRRVFALLNEFTGWTDGKLQDAESKHRWGMIKHKAGNALPRMVASLLRFAFQNSPALAPMIQAEAEAWSIRMEGYGGPAQPGIADLSARRKHALVRSA
jgi:hypothetical protein